MFSQVLHAEKDSFILVFFVIEGSEVDQSGGVNVFVMVQNKEKACTSDLKGVDFLKVSNDRINLGAHGFGCLLVDFAFVHKQLS